MQAVKGAAETGRAKAAQTVAAGKEALGLGEEEGEVRDGAAQTYIHTGTQRHKVLWSGVDGPIGPEANKQPVFSVLATSCQLHSHCVNGLRCPQGTPCMLMHPCCNCARVP